MKVVRKRIHFSFISALFLLLVGQQCLADSIMTEFWSFRALCVVVELEHDGYTEKVLNEKELHLSIIEEIKKQFEVRGFKKQIVTDAPCFPLNSDRHLLTLKMHVTAAVDARSDQSVLIAMIVHRYFLEKGIAGPHNFPTKIVSCAQSNLSSCSINLLNSYFNNIILPVIETVKSRM